ncbi:MAG: tandem-95 repeat protein [Armatimonadetes bacterium]|nr:tandem-95 repeat protein [Armatimonadota bacterium]
MTARSAVRRLCLPLWRAVFVGFLLSFLFLPSRAQAQLTLQITSPTPGQVITNEFGYVLVFAQLQTTYAVKTYSVQLNTSVKEYQQFVRSVSFTDMPSGEYTATARVEDQRGNVATDSVTFTLIRPTIEIIAPQPGEIARSELRVTARCRSCDYIETEIDPGHRTPFFARCDASMPSCVESPGVLKLDVVRPTSHLPLGDYKVAVFAGTSSLRIWKTVPITVVPDKGFRQLEKVPATYIRDVTPERLLYQTEGAPSELKVNALRIRDRRTGEDVAIDPNDTNGTPYAYLTPRGAIYKSGSTVYEWRDGQRIPVGNYDQLWVKGDYAVLKNLSSEIRLRNLVTGAETTITTQPYINPTDVGPNGDVLLKRYVSTNPSGTYDLLLWRSGSLIQIAQPKEGYARTDGVNIVYIETNTSTDYTLYQHTPAGNIRLATVIPDPSVFPAPVQLNNGWIAYQAKDPSSKNQVWVRSPAGETRKVSFFAEGAGLKALGPNGEVIFGRPVTSVYYKFGAHKLYLTDFNAKTETEIGFNLGEIFWQSGQPHLKAGGSLFVIGSDEDRAPPTVTATATPAPNDRGWNTGDVTLTLTASDAGSGPAHIQYSATGAQPIPSTTVNGDTASFIISTEGLTTVSYHAVDKAGNASSPQTLTLKLNRTAPVAQDQNIALDEDAPKAIPLTASDPGAGEPLTYVVLTPPAHGVLSGTAPHLTYTPHPNYHGPDQFTFRANDGTWDSNTATVTLAVAPVNDLPVAQDQSAATAEDTPVTLTLAASDPENDPLTYSVVTGPSHGTLSAVSGNQITYTPAKDFHGSDSFTFKAHDGKADSNTATVSLTVTPVNDPPQALDLALLTFRDRSLSFQLSATDAEGDPLTFAVVNPPQHGSLSGTASHLTYTPTPGYTGSDSFTYRATDGTLESPLATVSLNVIVPQLVIGSGRTGPGEAGEVMISLTEAVSEVAGLNLRLKAVGPDGAPPLAPRFRLTAATQGWNVAPDPNDPWHFTLASPTPLTGPADVLRLELTPSTSTAPGTEYRIEAVRVEVSDRRGEVTELAGRTAPGSLMVAPCETRGKGDVNGDGAVDIRDAIYVLRVAAEIEVPTNGCVRSAADVNCSGAVNVGDAVLILRHITFGEAFPACP